MNDDRKDKRESLHRSSFRLHRYIHLVNDCEHIVFAHDEEFFAVDFDFGAGVAGEEDFIAFFDGEGNLFPGFQTLAITDCDDSAAFGFFLGRVRAKRCRTWSWFPLRRA